MKFLHRWIPMWGQSMIRTFPSDLTTHFEGLIAHLCRCWRVRSCDKDDMFQTARLAVLMAARGYNASRGPFWTYAATCIRRAIADACQSEARRQNAMAFARESRVHEDRQTDSGTLDLPEHFGFEDRRLVSLLVELGVRESAFLMGRSPSAVVKATKKVRERWNRHESQTPCFVRG